MNKNEKIFIGILIAIFLIIIAVALIIRANNNKPQDNQSNQINNNVVEEKYAEVKEDGTKINKSNKLKETKKLADLSISNIQLTSKGNESYIQATVKNTGTAKAGDDFITITIVDDSENTITTVQGYLNTIEAGQETTLSIKTSVDFANAYDFTVSK